jgi:hypothetical protein
VHTGVIARFNCAECQKTPELKKRWGCDGFTAERAIYEEQREDGDIDRYWNCPLLFVPESVIEWFKSYKYYSRFPSAPMPDYEHVSQRFLAAVDIYENKLIEWRSKK